MAKNLSVLFVSSEVVPFAKTGGLADVSAALPLALTELGHDVRVILPKYGGVSERRNRIHEIKRLKEIPIEVGGEVTMATVKSSQVVNSRAKVQVYIITNDKYFEPLKGIYSDTHTGKEFPNNDERFIFFQKAVLETCKRLGWRPDVIHCNDWQTGLIPAFMKELYAGDSFFSHTRTVFTIHNMAYQGIYSSGSFEKTGLPARTYSPAGVEFFGHVNFMKAGLVYSDAISTVSPTYAKEIQTSEQGCGLEGVVKRQKEKLHGILNGIDTEAWNPSSDKLIDTQYNKNSLEDKFKNKEALAKYFRLKPDVDVPIIGIIGRMVDQKGFDLVFEALENILNLGVQIVVLGEGEKKYLQAFERAAKKTKNIGVYFGYDEELAHQIQAGSDMLLMPSHYEPCGLNQLYALAYGTVPIVHKTGGLADSISEYNFKKKTGNGLVFSDYTAKALIDAVERAITLYKNEELWEELQRLIMSEDHSWKSSAELYVEKLYRKG